MTSHSAMTITLSPPEYQSNRVIMYTPACMNKTKSKRRREIQEQNDSSKSILGLLRCYWLLTLLWNNIISTIYFIKTQNRVEC